jgi:hypothetical protein
MKCFAAAICAATVVAGFSASAATIDFTAASTGTTGTVGGVNWAMTTNIGVLNNSQRFDGQDSLASLGGTGLVFQRDGYGVRSKIDQSKNDDEITTIRGGMEAVTLTFAKKVKLTGFSFLDLYMAAGGKVGEVAYAQIDDGTLFSTAATDLANTGKTRRAGYSGVNFAGLVTKSVKFYIGLTNDKQGFADGALASVSVAPVPVPAAGLLLAGGLGGLAAVRRKRAAKSKA